MKKARLGYIDSGRGIAAILVMIFHGILSLSTRHEELRTTANLFEKYIDLGKIAVILFFVISGLVIPYSLKGIDKIISIKNFIISRFFRLYPVYWLSAFMGFIIYGFFSFKELFFNLSMFQQFVGIRNIIGLYWTLQIELIFYFLIALVFIFGKLKSISFLFKTSILFLALSLVMAFFRGYYEIKLPLVVPLALSIMFFGSFYRSQLIDQNEEGKKHSQIYLLLYLILIPIISKLGYDIDFGYGESWIKYTITYYLGMVLFLLMSKFKLSSVVTEYFGKISYSVYLFHPLVIEVFMRYFNIKTSGFLILSLILIVTLTFSSLSFWLIESPSIKLAKRLKNRYNHRD
jgi:peptidoglycan/LPS O-acetylase OafA/YrhL